MSATWLATSSQLSWNCFPQSSRVNHFSCLTLCQKYSLYQNFHLSISCLSSQFNSLLLTGKASTHCIKDSLYSIDNCTLTAQKEGHRRLLLQSLTHPTTPLKCNSLNRKPLKITLKVFVKDAEVSFPQFIASERGCRKRRTQLYSKGKPVRV